MGDIPSTINVQSNLQSLLFGDFDHVPSHADPSKMTLQPKPTSTTFIQSNPRVVDESDLFNAPSEEDESCTLESVLPSKHDQTPA